MMTDEELRERVDGAQAYKARPNGHAEHDEPRPELPPLKVRSMADLQGKPVPPLRYIANEWIPRGKAVLLSGRGGGGKTTLACQLGAARAIGANFLGLAVDGGTSCAFMCEEDEEDAHRALAKLAEHFGREIREFGSFHYLARSGEDNALVWRSARGNIGTTPLYDQMAQLIGDLKVTLNILDNARHVACINENDGSEVTAAWNLLHGLMRSTGGTTLLLGHTPKNGLAEFSGNAAWENVSRCRCFLGPAKTDPDGEAVENDPRRILRRGKSNANGTASIDLVWELGAFRLEHPELATFGDKLDREMRKGQACQAFLDALDELTRQRRNVSHAASAKNYAPKVMKSAGLCDDFSKTELEQAMNALFRESRIIASAELWKGTDRHPVTGIARCG